MTISLRFQCDHESCRATSELAVGEDSRGDYEDEDGGESFYVDTMRTKGPKGWYIARGIDLCTAHAPKTP